MYTRIPLKHNFWGAIMFLLSCACALAHPGTCANEKIVGDAGTREGFFTMVADNTPQMAACLHSAGCTCRR